MKNNVRVGRKINKSKEKFYNIFIVRSVILDVIFLLVGIYFINNPYSGLRGCEIAFSLVLLVSGVMALFDGTAKSVINLFNFSLIYGVLSIIFGLLIIFNPLALANMVTISFGIWMILSGLFKVSHALTLKKVQEECWMVLLAIGVIITVIGVLLVFNPFIQLYITKVVGIFLCLYSILDFTNSFLLKRRAKEILKTFK